MFFTNPTEVLRLPLIPFLRTYLQRRVDWKRQPTIVGRFRAFTLFLSHFCDLLEAQLGYKEKLRNASVL
jgi:hypothetical protein